MNHTKFMQETELKVSFEQGRSFRTYEDVEIGLSEYPVYFEREVIGSYYVPDIFYPDQNEKFDVQMAEVIESIKQKNWKFTDKTHSFGEGLFQINEGGTYYHFPKKFIEKAERYFHARP